MEEMMKAIRLAKQQEALAVGDLARVWDIYNKRVDFVLDEGGVIVEVKKRNSMFLMEKDEAPPRVKAIDWFGEN